MKVQARVGINFRAMYSCQVPRLAFSVLLKHVNGDGDRAPSTSTSEDGMEDLLAGGAVPMTRPKELPVTVGFVQYLRLLVAMMELPECAKFIKPASAVSELKDLSDTMAEVMGIAEDGSGGISSSSSSSSSSAERLCVDGDLQQFIKENKYTLHPCGGLAGQ